MKTGFYSAEMRAIADQYTKEEEYWLSKLSGQLMKHIFPYDFPTETHGGDFREDVVEFTISGDIFTQLMRLSNGSDLKLHMIFTAVLNLLLARYTGAADIIVGAPILKQDIEGEFINTVLILRNRLHQDMTFKELLLGVRQCVTEAMENVNYPLETLLYKLNMSFSDKDFPLFDIVVLVENIHDIRYIRHTSPNMIFYFRRTRQTIVGKLEYNCQHYSRETVERIACHFTRAVTNALAHLHLPLEKLEVLSPGEKEQLLTGFNQSHSPYPLQKTLHQLFEEQVERTPDHMALVAPRGEIPNYKSHIPNKGAPFGHILNTSGEMQLSYQELNKKSNQLAYLLKEKGVRLDTIVGIMVERSIAMIIGIFGILKAGGAYLPIDPDYPDKRIKYMLTDSSAKFLVTTPGLSRKFEKLSIVNCQLFMVNEKPSGCRKLNIPPKDVNSINNYQLTINHLQLKGNNLAYVIYTSGSTGLPRGVMIEHPSVVNLVTWHAGNFKLHINSHVALLSDNTFDVSVEDIFSTLIHGGTLYIPLKEVVQDKDQLVRYINERQVNVINFVPSGLKELLIDDKKPESLHIVISGGEKLDNRLKDRLITRRYQLYNCYGPTEITVDALWERCSNQKVSLGKPINNMRAYILGIDRLYLQPIGVPGELCLAGVGLARGYLDHVELTKEKFIHHPFIGGELIYRTGDLVRRLPHGNIEFLDRLDNQVKIRGIRIELGEVENQLLTDDQVKEAIVLAKEEKNGGKNLCAYIVAINKALFSVPRLKKYLQQRLPSYMIPTYFVCLDHIPLTPNGKVNRKALPEPEIKRQPDYTPPRNKLERKLLEIWSEVLAIEKEKIGIDSNFFDLGGHSLNATILLLKIHKELNVKVPLLELFRIRTIRRLAEDIITLKEELFEPIKPVEQREYYLLSSAQKRMYIIQQMDAASIAYNMPLMVLLDMNTAGKRGVKEKVKQVIQGLIARHESLRTSFVMIDEQLFQKVHDKVEFNLDAHHFYNDSDFLKRFIRPFDLSRAPLVRPALMKIDQNQQLLLMDMHHIISDGVSHDILKRDLISLLKGQDLPPSWLQYKDYAQWQNSTLQKKAMEEQEDYWLGQFMDEVPNLDLPLDFPRPAVQSFEGADLPFELNTQTTTALKQMVLDTGATLYMLLLAIYNVFLSKISGQEDIIVGTPIASRRHADLERLVGIFVNTIALRNFPGAGKTFQQFLMEVKANTLKAFENQEYQFEDLVEKVSTQRDANRNPIFDTMFTLQDMEARIDEISGADITGVGIRSYEIEYERVAKFTVSLTCCESDDSVVCSFVYCTKLFKKETIQRFIKYFQQLVAVVITNKSQKISQIEIITAEEKKKLLHQFNKTAAAYPASKTLHQLFEEQVERTPDNTALVGIINSKSEIRNKKQIQITKIQNSKTEGTRGLAPLSILASITYNELNRLSNQLAYLLIKKGVKSDTIVGIMVERFVEMIVGILGILKAGGAYMPIDPEYPRERIDFMLKDSDARILLKGNTVGAEKSEIRISKSETNPNDQNVNDKNSTATCCVLNFEYLNFEFVSNFEFPASNLNPSKLAYVIYTSGTTGKAKGVMVDHRNIVNYIHAFLKICSITSTDTMLQQASFTFDSSIEEIFPVLLKAGKIAIPTKYVILDIDLLMEFTAKNNITIIDCSPLLLNELNNAWQRWDKLNSVHTYISGGDVLKREYIDNILKEANVLNGYGPTETTVCVTYYMCSGDESSNIPLGKPIANYKVYILGKGNQLQPIGISGEICAAGDGVSRGYLNRPELTAEKYGLSPFNPGERLYRTGDLGRWQRDGNIQFLGRTDQQVKIRGFRIEPGEIECQLFKHKRIKEVVVVEKEGEEGIKYLCAYIVAGMELTVSQLREFLSVMLPDYMIPSYFVFLKKLPLTPNGKIDCRALPVPGVEKSSQYIPPGNAIERKLTELWSGVLSLQKDVISINRNFFELGGHSLKAILLTARMHKEFNVKVSLTEIFKSPTIQALAQYIREAETNRYMPLEPVEEKEYYLLSSAQKRLYIIQQMDEEIIAYNMPMMVPLDETNLGGKIDMRKLQYTVHQLIDRHDSFRTSFEMVDEQPVQRIHHPHDVDFEIEYFNLKKKNGNRVEVMEGIFRDFVRPFPLSRPPLVRVALVEVENTRYALMVDMHHIISDGFSHEILVRDFMVLYSSQVLSPLPIQYKDYAEWQSRERAAGIIKQQEEYWLRQFSGEIPVLDLPIDYPRPEVRSFEGDFIYLEINEALTYKTARLRRETEVTLNILLLAVYSVLLAKYSGQEDLVIATADAGRHHADLQQTIGMFVNMLPIRIQPGKNKTFKEFLLEVKQQSVNAYANQDYQFDDLVLKLGLQGNRSRNPVFDTVFVVQNTAMQNENLSIGKKDNDNNDFLEITQPEFRNQAFDLILQAVEGDDRLNMRLEYSTALFKKSTAEKMTNHYIDILKQVVENPGLKLKEIIITHDFLKAKPRVIKTAQTDFRF